MGSRSSHSVGEKQTRIIHCLKLFLFASDDVAMHLFKLLCCSVVI